MTTGDGQDKVSQILCRVQGAPVDKPEITLGFWYTCLVVFYFVSVQQVGPSRWLRSLSPLLRKEGQGQAEEETCGR